MKKTTAPSWIYLTLFVLAAAFIIPHYFLVDNENCLWDVLHNVGYGVFGSLVVAFLIDIGNTKAKKKSDSEKLKIITAGYRTAFLDLRDSVLIASEKRYGLDGQKRSFNEWLDYVLSPIDEQNGETQEDLFDCFFDIIFAVEKIEKSAMILQEQLLLNLDIEGITNELIQNIKSVRFLSAHIDSLFEEEKYVLVIKALKEHLIPKFLKNNEDYKQYFVEPYCEDRYTEE